jgi:hypothetical protein
MFPVPESNWMGRFAVNTAVGFQIGAARGSFSILSAMRIERDELLADLGRAVDELILKHREDLAHGRKLSRSAYQSRMRWVDGTPEYSFYVYSLCKLFPNARFIHLVRDVVRSMLNFHRVAGIQLVSNEEEAYRLWLQSVNGCVGRARLRP